MLIARALVTRRASNRMIHKAHTRIGDAFQLGNATIVRAGIGYTNHGQTFNFVIGLLSELKTRQHFQSMQILYLTYVK